MNKKDKVLIKIFQGGSTGLVQQKIKPQKPASSRYKEYVLPSIKDEIKKKYDIELVLIGGGPAGFSAVEEDAELMHKEFGHKIHDVGGTRPYNLTTFPYVAKIHMIKKLKKKGIKYALLSVVDKDNVIRQVTESSDSNLVGEKY